MTLPEEAIQEFKSIFFIEEGINLSDEEAEKRAAQLIDLFEDLLSTTKVRNNET